MRMVVLSVPAADAEIAADRMWRAGARGVEERIGGAGRVDLHTSLAADDAISRARLADLPAAWELRFVEVDPTPADTWRWFAHPVVVSEQLVLRPGWLPSGADRGVTEVSIDPGGAFGLGDHPTTRLSAQWVHELVRPGDRVLDVGCGSGVLAILAALVGAEHVLATDISDAALEATSANASVNGVADRITIDPRPVDHLRGEFDVVVANILAPTLVSMAADLRRLTATRGVLVVCGLLADHHDHVVAALGPMEVYDTRVLDGWAAVGLRHSGT